MKALTYTAPGRFELIEKTEAGNFESQGCRGEDYSFEHLFVGPSYSAWCCASGRGRHHRGA